MPSLQRQAILPASALAVLVLLLAGCGSNYPETVPVAGTVTLDGEPVAGAAVVFKPEEGQEATGTTDEAGKFELSTFRLGDGAVPGEHRVAVSKTTVDPDAKEEKVVFLVPKQYGNPETSGLTVQVQEEMGPVRLDLRSETGKGAAE